MKKNMYRVVLMTTILFPLLIKSTLPQKRPLDQENTTSAEKKLKTKQPIDIKSLILSWNTNAQYLLKNAKEHTNLNQLPWLMYIYGKPSSGKTTFVHEWKKIIYQKREAEGYTIRAKSLTSAEEEVKKIIHETIEYMKKEKNEEKKHIELILCHIVIRPHQNESLFEDSTALAKLNKHYCTQKKPQILFSVEGQKPPHQFMNCYAEEILMFDYLPTQKAALIITHVLHNMQSQYKDTTKISTLLSKLETIPPILAENIAKKALRLSKQSTVTSKEIAKAIATHLPSSKPKGNKELTYFM